MKKNIRNKVVVLDLEKDPAMKSGGMVKIRERLKKLCARKHVSVVVTTDKNKEELTGLCEDLPVTVLAENGTARFSGKTWSEYLLVDDSWKPLLMKQLVKMRVAGALRTTTEKAHSVIIDCDFFEMEELRHWLSPFISKFNLQWRAGSQFVQIISAGADKTLALYQYCLEEGLELTSAPWLHSSKAESDLSVA